MIRMGRVSIPTISLFILGVILVIMAGFSGPLIDFVTISIWSRILPYFLFIGGFILIILSVILMSRKS